MHSLSCRPAVPPGSIAAEVEDAARTEAAGHIGPLCTSVDASVPRVGETVLVSSMASDAHTWNLVFVQLLIEELGFTVVNLGPCVPDELLVAQCRAHRPAMVVLSSVNGHGYQEGLRVIRRLRAEPVLAGTPIVLGGKLGVAGGESAGHIEALLAAGFSAVYDDREDGTASFRDLLAARAGRELR